MVGGDASTEDDYLDDILDDYEDDIDLLDILGDYDIDDRPPVLPARPVAPPVQPVQPIGPILTPGGPSPAPPVAIPASPAAPVFGGFNNLAGAPPGTSYQYHFQTPNGYSFGKVPVTPSPFGPSSPVSPVAPITPVTPVPFSGPVTPRPFGHTSPVTPGPYHRPTPTPDPWTYHEPYYEKHHYERPPIKHETHYHIHKKPKAPPRPPTPPTP